MPMESKADVGRKGVNLSISDHVLTEALSLKLNLSMAAERGIVQEIRAAKAERWIQENKDAIDSYNELVDREGLILAKYRQF
jgi:antitoxin CcdA